jgi:hypothetical protein
MNREPARRSATSAFALSALALSAFARAHA